MTSILLAGPGVEPVSLAEAKTFLRVDSEDEDDLVQTLIAAARVHLEAVTRRAMISQSWRVSLDAWPEVGEVLLPIGPLGALTAVRVFDADGTATAMSLSQFLAEAGSAPGRIILPAALEPTPAIRDRLGIEIDFTVGYGATPADVPAGLIQAVLSLVGHWFENRDAVLMAGAGAVVPNGFDRLVAPFRVLVL